MKRQIHTGQVLGAALLSLLLVIAGAWYGLGHRLWPSASGSRASMLVMPAPVELSNTFTQIARQIAPAVVQVQAITRSRSPLAAGNGHGMPWPLARERSLGSGLIVDRRGFILTNAHVIRHASRVEVQVPGRDLPYAGRIVGQDKETDLAVIRIFPRRRLLAAPLGNSRSLEVGDWVLALGSPFGLQDSVTAGIVSALNRHLDINHPLQKFIQTDAAINPGNSGGPLVDMAGQVVGINTAIDTDTGANRGVGFALPSNLAIAVYNQLIAHGRVLRGSIGIYFQSHMGSLVRQMYGWHGVPISAVVDGGPAERAGLRVGDVIVAINGQFIHNGNDLSNAIMHQPVGSWLKLRIKRRRRFLDLNVQVADRDRLFGTHRVAERIPPHLPKLGLLVSLRPLGRAHDLSLPVANFRVSGVWVSNVAPGSFADRVAIRPGDWITAINRVRVTSLADYRHILSKLAWGQPVVFALLRPGPGSKLEPWYTGGYYGR